MHCPRSIARCSCCTTWKDTITRRSACCLAFRAEPRRRDCRERARSCVWRFTNSKENGPVPDEKKFDDFLQREMKDYRASATPPADAIWARIEQDVAEAIRPRTVHRFTARRAWLAA